MKTRVMEHFNGVLGVTIYTVMFESVIRGRIYPVTVSRGERKTPDVTEMRQEPDRTEWQELLTTPDRTKAENCARRFAASKLPYPHNWYDVLTVAEFDGENRIK